MSSFEIPEYQPEGTPPSQVERPFDAVLPTRWPLPDNRAVEAMPQVPVAPRPIVAPAPVVVDRPTEVETVPTQPSVPVQPFEVVERAEVQRREPPAGDGWTVANRLEPSAEGAAPFSALVTAGRARASTVPMDEGMFRREGRSGRRLPLLLALAVVGVAGGIWAAGLVPGLPSLASLRENDVPRGGQPVAVLAPVVDSEQRDSPTPEPVVEPDVESNGFDLDGVAPLKGKAPGKKAPAKRPRGGAGDGEVSLPPSKVVPPVPVARSEELPPPTKSPPKSVAPVPPPPPPPPSSPPVPAVAEAELLYKQGNLYLKEKKVALAIEEYKKCLAVDSRYGLAYRSLAVAYMLLGREKSAIEAYESFLRLEPGHRDAPKVKQIIDEYYARSGK